MCLFVPGLEQLGQTALSFSTNATVLVSQRITRRPDLLVALETHYNVAVVERNFTHLLGGNRHFADVILDECSAIVIEAMTSLKDLNAKTAETLKQNVAVLSLKYDNIWLMLENGASSV